jgi:hypothetical protein
MNHEEAMMNAQIPVPDDLYHPIPPLPCPPWGPDDERTTAHASAYARWWLLSFMAMNRAGQSEALAALEARRCCAFHEAGRGLIVRELLAARGEDREDA